jgi:ABC-type dipeptide/oligopeptide/nickel transport system permease subunit
MLPVGFSQTRKPTQLPVLTMVTVWVPETARTARGLLLRLHQEPSMIRRWRCD